MKLTYWISECLSDSEAYAIRRETKKEVLAELAARDAKLEKNSEGELVWWQGEPGCSTRFGPVHKVTVEYASAFDLLDQCLGEGRVYEGASQ